MRGLYFIWLQGILRPHRQINSKRFTLFHFKKFDELDDLSITKFNFITKFNVFANTNKHSKHIHKLKFYLETKYSI